MKRQNRWMHRILTCALLCGAVMVPLERLHAAPASGKAVEQALVNINKANVEELDSIRGIGPLLAQRIVDFRQANGRFEHLEDVIRVPGIGQAKFEKIKNQITL